jgi:hypothetical protein
MKNMQGAAEDIKKLGAFLSNLTEFANSLDHVSSLQQAANEAEQRIKQMAVKEHAAKESLLKHEEALLEAKAHAEGILVKAQAEAIKVVESAKARAGAMLVKADEEVQLVVGKIQERKIRLELQVQELLEKKAVHLVESQEVEAKLNALKSELESLKAKLGV